MNLFGAAADLQNGSIDCVQCGASCYWSGKSSLGDYMLVVTGQLRFGSATRSFTQSFPHREAPTPHREAPTPRREAMSEDRPKSGKPSFEM